MKKNIFILLCIIFFIIFIVNNKNDINNEELLNSSNEVTLNHIAWPIEFSDVPKIKAEAIDFNTKNEYYELYYKNISYNLFNSYLKELEENSFTIKNESNIDNIIKCSVSKNDIYMEFIWKNNENRNMQILLYRNNI